jgi:hypothetical protein
LETFNVFTENYRKVFIGAKAVSWQLEVLNQGNFSAISRPIIDAIVFLVEK